MRDVIDAHIHLSENRNDALRAYAENHGLRYNLKELMRLMKENRVVHGLLLSPPLQTGAPLPNEKIIQFCRRSEGKLSPVITVEPTKNEVAKAVKLAKENRREVKAFKIRLGYVNATADSPVFKAIYDYAQEENLPVLFHTGDTASSTGDLLSSHPLTLDRLANKREGLTIVLCHFGNPWFEDVAELIYKHPNVYTDISGLTTGGGGYATKFSEFLADRISEAVYFTGGAEKVIFGTDYPVTTFADALELVELLKIDDADKELILFRNAKKVFNF